MNMLTEKFGRRRRPANSTSAERDRFDQGETAGRGRLGGRRRGVRSGSGGARFAIAQAITTIAAIIATLIVVGIVLVLLKANPANDIVDALREIARFFAQPFDAIFELERRRPEIALLFLI